MKRVSLIVLLLFAALMLSAQSIEETLAQIRAAKAEYEENARIFEEKLEELGKSNPLFAPQGAFESDFEYVARFSQALPQIERMRKQYLGDVIQRLNNLRSKTWETTNITLSFGNYSPNDEIWELNIVHHQHQKENLEVKRKVERTTAKTIYDNRERLIIKGLLTVDLGDRVGLAQLMVLDPVTSAEFMVYFEPFKYYEGKIVDFSPDGKLVSMVKDNRNVLIFDVETGKQVQSYKPGVSVLSVSFSPDGKFLATGCCDDNARIFNIETGQQVQSYKHNDDVYSVAFSPDGKFLATGCDDKNARIFNIETGRQVQSYWHNYYVYSVAFSPDGKFLATGCYDKNALIFNIETGQQVQSYKHNSRVRSVDFSPDGKFLATGCDDNNARIFRISDNKEISSYKHGSKIAWSPIGNYLACSGDGKTRIIDVNTSKDVRVFNVEGQPVFSPDARFLAIGTGVYRTYISVEGAEPDKAISYPPQLAVEMQFSEPSGNHFLDALETGSIKLKFSNSGRGSAKGIVVKLKPENIPGLNYMNGYIAEVSAGKSIEVDIPIEAYIDVADGTHQLTISFEEANGFSPPAQQLTFSTRAYKKPELAFAEIGINDSNQNGKIEAGEMIELTLRVTNRGVGTASGSYAKFYSGENVFISDRFAKTQEIGELKPGQSKDLKLEFFVNERCANEIPLYADFTEATGIAGATKVRVPITKSDPTRQISSLVITGKEESY